MLICLICGVYCNDPQQPVLLHFFLKKISRFESLTHIMMRFIAKTD